MFENEINVTTTCIMSLAHQPQAEKKIQLLLTSLFASHMQKGGFDVQSDRRNLTVSSSVVFSDKEISVMASTFKKIFIANGLTAHVLKKPCGKNTFCYEIRYRSNGYNIRASSTDLSEAKRKFLHKTTPKEIEKYRVQEKITGTNALQNVFDEWLRYKKGTVTDKTLQSFNTNFSALPESLRNTPITGVRTGDIDKILKNETPRKYEELRTLFNGVFKYAVASGIIAHNPVAIIRFKRAERQSRDALSEEEIYSFLEKIRLPEYAKIRQGAYLLYFFGLRPCEIDEETHREGDFLIARNRKRKNGKIEYKKIPIPKQAENLIDWNKPFTFGLENNGRSILFRKLFSETGKTAYCLRHTFSTICQQYLSRPDIVDIWMGDSPQRLVGKVYTHFPDKFMREQMDLIVFPTLEK